MSLTSTQASFRFPRWLINLSYAGIKLQFLAKHCYTHFSELDFYTVLLQAHIL